LNFYYFYYIKENIMFLNEKEDASLREKWGPVMDHESVDPIPEGSKRDITIRLLENQHQALEESGMAGAIDSPSSNNTTGQIAGWDPIMINLVRRATPQLLAYDTVGVQPMTGPTGMVFYMKSHYDNANGTAPGVEQWEPGIRGNVDYSGSHKNADGQTMGTTGTNSATATSAADDATGTNNGGSGGQGFYGNDQTNRLRYPEMQFSIEKVSVEARTRALKARYTTELAQDLKVVHGLDAESELASILSSEIIAETNWEVIDRMNTLAKSSLIGKPGSGDDGDVYDFATVNVEKAGVLPGAVGGSFKYLNSRNEQVLTTAGYKTVADLATTDQLVLHSNNIDLNDFAHNGGARWAGEKYKSLIMQINKEANIIARETGRGRGNFLIVSADIAAALDMTSALAVPSVDGNAGNNDITQNLFAGVLGGKYKVFVDPYAGDNTILIGYKGAKEMDAGMFYCPYVPLQMMKAQGEEDFQPRIGFKSRYGLINNPFAGGQDLNFASAADYAGKNPFYRKFSVSGI
jgi:hypothetical protein